WRCRKSHRSDFCRCMAPCRSAGPVRARSLSVREDQLKNSATRSARRCARTEWSTGCTSLLLLLVSLLKASTGAAATHVVGMEAGRAESAELRCPAVEGEFGVCKPE